MSESRLDVYGRLRWGLVAVDGTTVYAPWHKVSETVNRKVWDAIESSRKHDHSKGGLA